MVGFGLESRNRVRCIALFASLMSYSERQELPQVRRVGRTVSFLKYLCSDLIPKPILCIHVDMYVGVTEYVML